MTRVKICGIRRVEDAMVAADAGADFLGFVFYEGSRRMIEPEVAREIIGAVRRERPVKMVGVFVNASAQRVSEIARAAGLDYVQLSGDEPESMIESLELPAIQVIHVDEEVEEGFLAERIAGTPAELVLLDTSSADHGGSGRTFDWQRVPVLERSVLLAGGLHAGNVAEAIRQVHPWGVDVSSGVETGGEKDRIRIREFITAAKENHNPPM